MVDFGGDDIYVIAHGEVLVIFLQYVVVDDGAYHSNVLDTGFSVFCLEGGQVEPATESGVDDDNVCRMHVNVVLQRFRRRNLNRVCIQVGNTLQNSRQATPDDDRSFCNDNLQRSIIVHFQFPFYLRYGGNKHIIFYLAVGGKVLFAVEYIEQDRIQEIVVLLFRVVFDDDVLQLFQFGIYLIMFAGKSGNVVFIR